MNASRDERTAAGRFRRWCGGDARSQQPCLHRVIWAALVCGALVALGGCQSLFPLPPAEEGGAPLAGSSPDLTATGLPAYPAPAYPGPGDPGPKITELHDAIVGLPDGVTVADEDPVVDDESYIWIETTYGANKVPRTVRLVRLNTAGGRHDMAVVVSTSDESRAIRLLVHDGVLDIEPDRIEVAGTVTPSGDQLVYASAGDEERLVVLAWSDPDTAAIRANLVLPEFGKPELALGADLSDELKLRGALPGWQSTSPDSIAGVVDTDWLGDGHPGYLVFRAGPSALLYPGGDGSAADGRRPHEPAAELTDPMQLVDVDGDGAEEVVVPDGDGWRVSRWSGDAFVDEPTLRIGASPQPIPVVDGDLPALPADLYFVRQEKIVRWPRSGARLELVADASDAKANPADLGGALVSSRGPWSFALAGDGRSLLYSVDHTVREAPDRHVGVSELVTYDVAGASSRTIAIGDLPIVQAAYEGAASLFDLTRDGTMAAYVRPERMVTVTQGSGYTSLATEVVSTEVVAVVRVDAPESELVRVPCGMQDPDDVRGECRGFLFSPSGDRLAVDDDAGVWVVDLPGGKPRLVLESGAKSHPDGMRAYRIVSWSPDGTRILLDVSHNVEGGSAALLDVRTGQVQDIDNTFQYVEGWSDLAWAQDGQHLIHARDDGPAPLTIIDAADPAGAEPVPGIASPLAGLIELARLDSSWRLAPTASPFDPHVLPDGRIGFGTRRSNPAAVRDNAVFAVDHDGGSRVALAALPAMPSGDEPTGYAYPGGITWSPHGAAFLFTDGPIRIIGTALGQVAWDATAVLADADHFRWGPDDSRRD
jgi:hypothetical protein